MNEAVPTSIAWGASSIIPAPISNRQKRKPQQPHARQTPILYQRQWVNLIAGPDLAVIDPSTEEAVATIALGGRPIRTPPPPPRLLLGLFTNLDQARIELVEAIVANMNAVLRICRRRFRWKWGPLDLARNSQTPAAPGTSMALKAAKDWSPIQRPGDHALIIASCMSYGVCALITPWNWP